MNAFDIQHSTGAELLDDAFKLGLPAMKALTD